MKTYFRTKMSDVILTLTIHEGDARTRLANVFPKLLVLPTNVLPDHLQRKFDEVMRKLKIGCATSVPGTSVAKVGGIKNSTASKMISDLVECYDWVMDSDN